MSVNSPLSFCVASGALPDGHVSAVCESANLLSRALASLPSAMSLETPRLEDGASRSGVTVQTRVVSTP